jgi:hypothetical protein
MRAGEGRAIYRALGEQQSQSSTGLQDGVVQTFVTLMMLV